MATLMALLFGLVSKGFIIQPCCHRTAKWQGGGTSPSFKIIALLCLHLKSLSLIGGDTVFWGKNIPLLLSLNYSVAVPSVIQ